MSENFESDEDYKFKPEKEDPKDAQVVDLVKNETETLKKDIITLRAKVESLDLTIAQIKDWTKAGGIDPYLTLDSVLESLTDNRERKELRKTLEKPTIALTDLNIQRLHDELRKYKNMGIVKLMETLNHAADELIHEKEETEIEIQEFMHMITETEKIIPKKMEQKSKTLEMVQLENRSAAELEILLLTLEKFNNKKITATQFGNELVFNVSVEDALTAQTIFNTLASMGYEPEFMDEDEHRVYFKAQFHPRAIKEARRKNSWIKD